MASTTRAPAAVLSLYRSILRSHSKHLPREMKELGDAYVKSEFRLHKSVTKPDQLNLFFEAWESYLEQILSTARAKETVATGLLDSPEGDSQQTQVFEFGKDLPSGVELTDEQVAQLEKLKEETGKVGNPGST